MKMDAFAYITRSIDFKNVPVAIHQCGNDSHFSFDNGPDITSNLLQGGSIF